MGDADAPSGERSRGDRRPGNPLQLIAVSLLVIEVIVVSGAVVADDVWVSRALAGGSIALLAFLAVGSALLVWKRPHLLYGPGDFEGGTTMEDYVRLALGAHRRQLHDLRQRVEAGSEHSQLVFEEDEYAGEEEDECADEGDGEYEAAEGDSDIQLAPGLRQRDAPPRRTQRTLPAVDSISIDLSALSGDPADVETMAIDALPTVADLLNFAYFAARPGTLAPFTYGSDWVLVDERTGAPIDARSARLLGRLQPDDRSLEEAGIRPGDSLAAQRTGESPSDG